MLELYKKLTYFSINHKTTMAKYLCLIIILAFDLTSQVNYQWSKFHNDTITYINSTPYYSNNEGYAMRMKNGKIFVSGVCYARINSNTYGRIVTMAYDENGNILWKKNFADSYLQFTNFVYVYSMNIDNNGDIVISGRNYSKIILLKYSQNGNLLWANDTIRDNSIYSTPFLTAIDQQGNIFAAKRDVVNLSFDIIVRKYNPDGEFQWEKTYNGSSNFGERPLTITTDNSGNVIIGGYENEYQGSWGYCCVLKYDTNGNLLWNKTYPSVKGKISEVSASSNGNIYTAGTLLTSFPNHEIIIIKYNSNGTQDWVTRYAGRPSYLWNETYDMTIDNNGNAYIAGYTEKGYPFADYVTLKYNSSGILQWASYFNSAYDFVDIPSEIETDNNGSVYITGMTMMQNGECYTTIKYNNAGAMQWSNIIDAELSHPGYIYPSMEIYNSNIYIFGSKKIIPPHQHTDYMLTKLQQVIGITSISSQIPKEYCLVQNYPNPFNPVTNIKFDIVKKGIVKLIIYDALGRSINELVNQELNPGSYKVDWDASSYPSGIYFYKLQAGEFTETRKMILIK